MDADSPVRRRAERARRATTRPLRRTPKRLSEPPVAIDATRGAGIPFRAGGRPGAGAAPPRRGEGATGFTDEEAARAAAEGEGATGPDPELLERVRGIASRLALRRPRQDALLERGRGALRTLPYRGGSDDIDLDASLEVLAERPFPEDEDIAVRERARTRRAVVLAIDVSGSMRGERIRTAAATVGALAGELAHDALGVIAFWSDAAILLRPGDAVVPEQLLEALVRLPARGLTNVSFPLELAADLLARESVRDARVLLLSDCVHNAGPDPRSLAAALPRLDVLIDVEGEHDLELARDLAAAGRGAVRAIRGHRDVAPAIEAIFAA